MLPAESSPGGADGPPIPDPTFRWSDSLASARPSGRYRVEEIFFDMVRDRFYDLGWFKGDVLICVENVGPTASFVGPDGRWRRVERAYARFVRVKSLGSPPWPTQVGEN